MRIYSNFRDATNEIKRDLKEMGVHIRTTSYQDKILDKNDMGAETLECQDYTYRVTKPLLSDLKATHPWVEAEWFERSQGIEGFPVNPGTAWQLRRDVWEQFLQGDGKFGYTYAERFSRDMNVSNAIHTLRKDGSSRQSYIAMWDSDDSGFTGGRRRIPCTLGYQLQVRNEKLNITYLQRSADFATHFQNDLYLAVKLMEYVADKLQVAPGMFTHWVGSLHVFKRDVEGVF